MEFQSSLVNLTDISDWGWTNSSDPCRKPSWRYVLCSQFGVPFGFNFTNLDLEAADTMPLPAEMLTSQAAGPQTFCSSSTWTSAGGAIACLMVFQKNGPQRVRGRAYGTSTSAQPHFRSTKGEEIVKEAACCQRGLLLRACRTLRGMSSIPPEWGQNGAFPSLEVMDLRAPTIKQNGTQVRPATYNNQFMGALASLNGWGLDGSLSHLKELKLGYNMLSGSLFPDWLDQLSNLTHLDLVSNNLTGFLPSEWGASGLTELRLQENQLSGSIPPSWSRLGSAELLPGNNGLCAAIPANFRVLKAGTGTRPTAVSTLPTSNCWHGALCSFAATLTWNDPNVGPTGSPTARIRGWPNAGGPTLNGRAVWTDACSDPCTTEWTGVFCDDSGPYAIDLAAYSISGYVDQYGGLGLLDPGNSLSQLSSLRSLNLSSNLFGGPLPSFQLPNLTVLNLTNTGLNGTIPEQWATGMPKLQNPGLTGPLPDWGSNPGSLNLTIVDFSDCALTGTVPSSWEFMSDMTYFSLRNNRLSGSLPDWRWDSIRVFDLSSNEFQGSLPQSYHDPAFAEPSFDGGGDGNEVWPAIWWLDLSNNRLSGSLSADFSVNYGCGDEAGAYHSNFQMACSSLDVSNNSFSGLLPDSFQQSAATHAVAILPGNEGLFGQPPGLELINTANSRWLKDTYYYCLDSPYLPPDRPLGDAADQVLAEIGCTQYRWIQADESPKPPQTSWGYGSGRPAAFPFPEANLGQALRNISEALGAAEANVSASRTTLYADWPFDGTPACQFSGVHCDSEQNVIGINMTGRGLKGTLVNAWSAVPGLQYLDLSHNLFTGRLPASWATGFQQLQTLDLSYTQLNSILPEDWTFGFPQLRSLNLTATQLSGQIPAVWANTWPKLTDLQIASTLLSGSLPNSWAKPGSFPSLQILNLTSNPQLGGQLPAFGSGSASRLQQILLSGCAFSGGLVGSWAALPALRQLDVQANRLTGHLPLAWGVESNNESAMPSLSYLQLSDNSRLGGTLPNEWGSDGSMSQLRQMSISQSHLSGTLPNWKQDGRMPSLQQLQVGNTGLCGSVPSNVVVTNGSQQVSDLGSCPSSFKLSKAAIAGIVVGVVVALALVSGALLMLWRRQLIKAKRAAAANYDPLEIFYAASEGKLSSSQSDESSLLSEDPESDLLPTRLRIVEVDGVAKKLGAGGFGQVFQAILDGEHGVAIKFLNPVEVGQSLNKAHSEKFEAEIRIMLLLQHTNVIACYGAHMTKDLIYCVSELAAGGDLEQALAKDADRDYSWYKRGKGAAKLGDVGLARMLDSKSALTQTAALVGGTYNYQAPETLFGKKTTFSADIWSYGVLLLEIITGEVQQRGFYKKPTHIPEQCPAHIAALVDQCMADAPEQRPSAKDIIRRLQRSSSQPGKAAFLSPALGLTSSRAS
ncbi:hypothetical protein WJX73_001704 [Symbiochloris irregularis]|uniref:Protein kinase domain-containing protein n=1 Tax=Symbiochloris irregularis TaxID=706552 RepID=A0AAW1NRK6_9CHLO